MLHGHRKCFFIQFVFLMKLSSWLNIHYIPEAREQFSKYFSRYSTKHLKSKVSGAFCPHYVLYNIFWNVIQRILFCWTVFKVDQKTRIRNISNIYFFGLKMREVCMLSSRTFQLRKLALDLRSLFINRYWC